MFNKRLQQGFHDPSGSDRANVCSALRQSGGLVVVCEQSARRYSGISLCGEHCDSLVAS